MTFASKTAIYIIVKHVSVCMGVKVNNHVLRRTYGRTLWSAGVLIETIAELMGHEDTKTTTDHLGLNLDDQDDAMRKLAQFQSTVKYGVGQKAGCESGQSGFSERKQTGSSSF